MQVVYESPKKNGQCIIVSNAALAAGEAAVKQNCFETASYIFLSWGAVDKETTLVIKGIDQNNKFITEAVVCEVNAAAVKDRVSSKRYQCVTSILNIGGVSLTGFEAEGRGVHYVVEDRDVISVRTPVVHPIDLVGGGAKLEKTDFNNKYPLLLSWDAPSAPTTLEIVGSDGIKEVTEKIQCTTAVEVQQTANSYLSISAITNISDVTLPNFSAKVDEHYITIVTAVADLSTGGCVLLKKTFNAAYQVYLSCDAYPQEDTVLKIVGTSDGVMEISEQLGIGTKYKTNNTTQSFKTISSITNIGSASLSGFKAWVTETSLTIVTETPLLNDSFATITDNYLNPAPILLTWDAPTDDTLISIAGVASDDTKFSVRLACTKGVAGNTTTSSSFKKITDIQNIGASSLSNFAAKADSGGVTYVSPPQMLGEGGALLDQTKFKYEHKLLLSWGAISAPTNLGIIGTNLLGEKIGESVDCNILSKKTTDYVTEKSYYTITSILNLGAAPLPGFSARVEDDHVTLIASSSSLNCTSALMAKDVLPAPSQLLLSWGAISESTELVVRGTTDGKTIVSEMITCPQSFNAVVDQPTLNYYKTIISIVNAGLSPLPGFGVRVVENAGVLVAANQRLVQGNALLQNSSTSPTGSASHRPYDMSLSWNAANGATKLLIGGVAEIDGRRYNQQEIIECAGKVTNFLTNNTYSYVHYITNVGTFNLNDLSVQSNSITIVKKQNVRGGGAALSTSSLMVPSKICLSRKSSDVASDTFCVSGTDDNNRYSTEMITCQELNTTTLSLFKTITFIAYMDSSGGTGITVNNFSASSVAFINHQVVEKQDLYCAIPSFSNKVFDPVAQLSILCKGTPNAVLEVVGTDSDDNDLIDTQTVGQWAPSKFFKTVKSVSNSGPDIIKDLVVNAKEHFYIEVVDDQTLTSDGASVLPNLFIPAVKINLSWDAPSAPTTLEIIGTNASDTRIIETITCDTSVLSKKTNKEFKTISYITNTGNVPLPNLKAFTDVAGDIKIAESQVLYTGGATLQTKAFGGSSYPLLLSWDAPSAPTTLEIVGTGFNDQRLERTVTCVDSATKISPSKAYKSVTSITNTGRVTLPNLKVEVNQKTKESIADVPSLAGNSAYLLNKKLNEDTTLILSWGAPSKATQLEIVGTYLSGLKCSVIIDCAASVVGNTKTTQLFGTIISITNIGSSSLPQLDVHTDKEESKIVASTQDLVSGSAVIDIDYYNNEYPLSLTWDAPIASGKLLIKGADKAGQLRAIEEVKFDAGKSAKEYFPDTGSVSTKNTYQYIRSITNASAALLPNFKAEVKESAKLFSGTENSGEDWIAKPPIILDPRADGFAIQFTPQPIIDADTTKTFTGCTNYKAKGTMQPIDVVPTFSGSVTGPATATPSDELAWTSDVTVDKVTGAAANKAGIAYRSKETGPLSAIRVETDKLFGKLVVDILALGQE